MAAPEERHSDPTTTPPHGGAHPDEGGHAPASYASARSETVVAAGVLFSDKPASAKDTIKADAKGGWSWSKMTVPTIRNAKDGLKGELNVPQHARMRTYERDIVVPGI